MGKQGGSRMFSIEKGLHEFALRKDKSIIFGDMLRIRTVTILTKIIDIV